MIIRTRRAPGSGPAWRFAAALAATGGVLLALCGCGVEKPEPAAGAPVILISIDTLRSDHLAAYGYKGVDTPSLDLFRADAVLFHRAYSPTPMTLPSHVTMLTGLQPNRHGVRNNVGFRYDPERFPSVPQILRQRGYATGAAVSSYVLRGESGMRGAFDAYDDAIAPQAGATFSEYQRRGGVSASVAKQWISAHAGQPFFYFLHLYEPHVPYEPPEPFRSRYRSAYDGEIAAADAIIGDFLDHLRRTGLYDRALIVITSDHGEGLGDHGEEQHSVLIYREALQVPLFIKFPQNQRAGQTVLEPVQLADLAPTMLVAVGAAGHQFDGVALSGGAIPEDRAIYSESLFPLIHLGWSELRSVVVGRHHYIESPKPELYDLVADPGERSNLIDSERRTAGSLRASLNAIERGEITPAAVDPETARKLAALGYLGAPGVRRAGERLNPVEHIGFLNEIRDALELAATGKASAAIPRMRSLLARYPDALELRLELAEVLAEELRTDEAAVEYAEALRRASVPLPDVALQSAALLLRVRRFDDAETDARKALSALPAKANELLARIELAKENQPAASSYADAAWEAGRSPAQLVLRAEVAQQGGDFGRAFSLLDEAERLRKSGGLASTYRLHFVRADTLAKSGRTAEAIAEYEVEIEQFPSDLDAYAALAVLHFLSGNRREVDQVVDLMVGRNPTARAREIAARTYEAFDDPAKARRWRSAQRTSAP